MEEKQQKEKMKLFKRNFDKRPKKEKALLLRFSILVVGAVCFVIYGYMSGHKLITGEDLVTEVTHVHDFYHHMSMSDESWTQGGVASYARVLSASPTNSSHPDYSKCKDSSIQPDVCVGYGDSSCKRVAPKDAPGALIGVVLGLLYLFVGIAIVCDELFVPALEIIAEDLELSNDVAGATLMAAGGSAPELATSFVGAFKRSDVGFGTIVGSAVFNVLFVIAMCVIATPAEFAPLSLTWWPLFRDCSYYVITLATLAVFMSDGKIEIWEAFIQFFLYCVYVFLMSKNEILEAFFTKLFGLENYNPGSSGKIAPEDAEGGNVLDQSIETGKNDIELTKIKGEDTVEKPSSNINLNKPSTFRVGILQLMTSKLPITETAGIAFVSQIKGDVDAVFKRIDTNDNGEIDLAELKTCLKELGTPEDELTDEAVQSIMKDIDKSNNGHANKNDFTVWYTRAETRLKNKTREIFEKYATLEGGDGDKNTINKDQVYKFMSELGHHDTPGVEKAMQELLNSIESPLMTLEQFTQWYEHSVYWDAEKASAEQAAEAQESMWQGILNGFRDFHEMPISAKVSFVGFLPLSLISCLIPDCRPPGKEKLAPATLICSVLMIALFSIVMVELAEIFGKTVGIPDVVMGLTILAAGTSVPDLLSSVIVAQQGEGDMAVSSSIGSNIFDVAFGLPLPWLTFNIVALANNCECSIQVSGDTNSLLISICTLLVMVAAIILVIMYNGWKMTHQLGGAMFVLYFAYLAFALLMTPKSEYVVEKCDQFKLL